LGTFKLADPSGFPAFLAFFSFGLSGHFSFLILPAFQCHFSSLFV
jgi:hypothetical protein